MRSRASAPGQVVDAALGRVVASNGGDSCHAIHGGHVDDAAPAAFRHSILLHHLPPHCLAALHTQQSQMMTCTPLHVRTGVALAFEEQLLTITGRSGLERRIRGQCLRSLAECPCDVRPGTQQAG